MMRAWPAKTRRPHPATRTASPTSGLRPRPAEPGDYRSHGGSRRTQRTADNPPAAQSTLPRTGISRVRNSLRVGTPQATTLRNDPTE